MGTSPKGFFTRAFHKRKKTSGQWYAEFNLTRNFKKRPVEMRSLFSLIK